MMAEPPLSEYLWESTISQREDARNSKFIKGLEQGNLDPTYFGAYMVQDSVYCYRIIQSMTTAEGRATDQIKEFLQKKLNFYQRYYRDMCKTWHITGPDGIQLCTACADYVALEKTVAETMSPVYLVVALLAGHKLWPWLGQQILDSPHNFGVYENWINANLNPKHLGYKIMEKIVDEAFVRGEIDRDEALRIYKECMTLEAKFFNFDS